MDAQQSTSQDGGTFLSPKKKRPCVALSATEKLWVRNVYKYVFEVKSSESNIDVPKASECVNKVAEVLGISIRTVYSVLKEHKENDRESPKPPKKSGPKHTFKEKLDDFTFTAIRRIVHQFFHRNELPTIAKVLKVVNDDPGLPNFSKETMRKIMKHLKIIKTKVKSINQTNKPKLLKPKSNT